MFDPHGESVARQLCRFGSLKILAGSFPFLVVLNRLFFQTELFGCLLPSQLIVFSPGFEFAGFHGIGLTL